MQPLRWGVLGVSEMVGRLAVLPALRQSPTADLVAVASRDLARASHEADLFVAPNVHGDYESLLADPEVEAVYIPLPNGLHCEWTLRALAAGKHVLCEKPIACTAAEAREMANAAAKAGRVLMEGYMPAFHPRMQFVLEQARSGALGDLRSMRSVFTFTNRDAANHRWLPAMGGGALLDVGVYCLSPQIALAGPPQEIEVHQRLAPSGVDVTFTGNLEYAGGVSGSFFVSFDAPEEQRLEVSGTKRTLILFEEAFTGGSNDRAVEVFDSAGHGHMDGGAANSYLAMVEHFAAVVRGEAESLRPPAASIAVLEVIDRLHAAAGEAG